MRATGLASGQILLGAAGLAIWGILWLLFLSDYTSPPGRGLAPDEDYNPDAMSVFHDREPLAPIDLRRGTSLRVIHDSAPLRPAPACRSGMIELDGGCTFGEEIEVSSPPGWRRRSAYVETD